MSVGKPINQLLVLWNNLNTEMPIKGNVNYSIRYGQREH